MLKHTRNLQHHTPIEEPTFNLPILTQDRPPHTYTPAYKNPNTPVKVIHEYTGTMPPYIEGYLKTYHAKGWMDGQTDD